MELEPDSYVLIEQPLGEYNIAKVESIKGFPDVFKNMKRYLSRRYAICKTIVTEEYFLLAQFPFHHNNTYFYFTYWGLHDPTEGDTMLYTKVTTRSLFLDSGYDPNHYIISGSSLDVRPIQMSSDNDFMFRNFRDPEFSMFLYHLANRKTSIKNPTYFVYKESKEDVDYVMSILEDNLYILNPNIKTSNYSSYRSKIIENTNMYKSNFVTLFPMKPFFSGYHMDIHAQMK